MAVINTSAGNKAILALGATAANANVLATPALVVPYLQDISINNSTGVFRWKTLDATAESAATTPATNQVTLNVVVDDKAFFGNASLTDSVANTGIYGCSKNKTRVFFEIAFNGATAGQNYLSGSGFISGLAPTVNPDAPLWVTPVTIEVDGDFGSDVTL
jgi:hypothetical protein